MISEKAAVFTGQGAQRPGMGQDFVEIYPESKAIFQQASDAIGEDMEALCFNENTKLDLTEYTQPAIITTEIAILKALEKGYGFQAQYFAGHSLGEYAALVAAGVFLFQDTIKIVKKRGQLMQKAVPEGIGAMAALLMENIEKTEFASICSKMGAEIANYNSASQIVISGKKECVDKAMEKLGSTYAEMKIVVLPVSAPFHSSLMKEIEDEFKDYLNSFSSNFDLGKAGSVLSNFTGTFHTPESVIANLVKQISGSVQWIQNMKEMIKTGAEIYEIGPNKVLSKFFGTLDVQVPAIINERAAKKAFT
jgi:malonyl CoA-acyl carrier protein transacylase